MNNELGSINQYIESQPTAARQALLNIRALVKEIVPDAAEVISYKMPAFKKGKILIYYAAFKNHIGIYPPIKETPELLERLKPFMGPKGNLKFPLSEAMPFGLIGEVIAQRHKEISNHR